MSQSQQHGNMLQVNPVEMTASYPDGIFTFSLSPFAGSCFYQAQGKPDAGFSGFPLGQPGQYGPTVVHTSSSQPTTAPAGIFPPTSDGTSGITGQAGIFGPTSKPSSHAGIFGPTSKPSSHDDIFGPTSKLSSHDDIFGPTSKPAAPAGIFGPTTIQSITTKPTTHAGIFGPTSKPAAPAGIFGPTTPTTHAGIFGPTSKPAAPAGIFGPTTSHSSIIQPATAHPSLYSPTFTETNTLRPTNQIRTSNPDYYHTATAVNQDGTQTIQLSPSVSLTTNTATTVPEPDMSSIPMMASFTQIAKITDHLFLSAAAAVNANSLLRNGISTVINLTVDVPPVKGANVEYIRITVDDVPHANLGIYFDRLADKIGHVKDRGGRTLVHCVAGVSRSSSICIAYLMKYYRMPLAEAYRYVKAHRAIIRPNVGFFHQLIDYERKLFGKTSVQMIDSPIGPIPDLYKEETRGMVYMNQGHASGSRKHYGF